METQGTGLTSVALAALRGSAHLLRARLPTFGLSASPVHGITRLDRCGIMNHARPSSDTNGMSTPSGRTRISVPDHVITRVVGGSTVILDVQSGRSFTLDAVGSRVWSLLVSTGSVRMALDSLVSEFNAEPAQVEHDVLQLVERLADASLVTTVPETA